MMPPDPSAVLPADNRQPSLRRAAAHYGLAILLSLLTLAVRLLLQRIVGYDEPLLPFVLPIVVSAWIGGLGPGLLATGLCLLGATFLFVQPIYSLRITNANDLTRVLTFLAEGLAISVIGRFQNRPRVRQREALMRQQSELLDLSTDAMLVWQLGDTIRFWNHGAERLYGWSRAEALGQRSHALLKTQLPLPAPEFERMIAGAGQWSGALTQTTRDGRTIVVESQMTVVPQSSMPPLVLETNRDVTERKAAEAEVRAQSARLQVQAEASRAFAEAGSDEQAVLSQVVRAIATNLDAGCMIRLVSSDGRWLKTVALYDSDPDALAMMREMGVTADVPANASNPIGRILEATTPLVMHDDNPELQRQRVSPEHKAAVASLHVISAAGIPLRASGRALGALTMVRHRPTQGPFTQRDLQLAQDLADRAALAIENAQLFQSAQLAARTRDAVMASVSHDLRNPLSVIDGYAKVLRRRVSRGRGVEPDSLLDIVGKIEHTAGRMNHMIADLVDTARLEAGYSLTLQLAPTALDELIQQSIAHYATTTTQHELRFRNEVGQVTGDVDAARIERVVGNLLSNAIKYSPAGGPIDIVLRTEQQGQRWAVLAVRDRGVGIPDDDMPLIFEQYHRAANVGAISGTGVGLATSRQIVQQHGGDLAVASVPGQGSTFTLRLPLPGQPLDPDSAADAASAGAISAP